MPIGLTDEQNILADASTRFLTQDYDFDTHQRLVETELGFDPDHWKRVVDLGWVAAPIPESLGGLGLGLFDCALIMRAIGKSLFVSPYFSTVHLAARLIVRRGTSEQAADLLESVLAGTSHIALGLAEPRARFDLSTVDTTATKCDGGFRVNGRKRAVLWAEAADRVLVPARVAGQRSDKHGLLLLAIDKSSDGFTEKSYRTVDGQRASEIDMSSVFVPEDGVIGEDDNLYEDLQSACDEATVLIAAEAVGCISALRDQTLAYLKQREQFGRPIGKFQAVQHKMVDMDIAHDTVESIVFAAADHFDRGVGEDQRARLASAAKAQAGWSGQFVAETAIQLHGAIGMTNDLPIGHYLKRLTTIGVMLGDSAYHVRRFGRLDDRSWMTDCR